MKDQGSAKKIAIRVVSIVVIVLSAMTIGVSAFLVWQPFKRQSKTPVVLSGESKQAAGSSSKYEGWSSSFTNFLVCGIDKTGKLTDVIMVVALNTKSGQINVMQIPRDTYAGSDIPTYKYNAVYGSNAKYDGMENLKAHVERDFGIKIDHYASITTDGLDKLVDAAGGVDLTVPMTMNYDDPYQDLHIHLKKGYQHLNGNQAEQLVRFRHGYSEGDIGRLDTQKLFLAAFSSKLKSMSKLDLTAKILPVLVGQAGFTTDLNGLQLIQLGVTAQKINMSSINVQTMPGEPFYLGKASLFSVHKQQLLEVLNKYFVPSGYTLNESDLKIRQMADQYTDYTNSGDNFDNILQTQSGKSTTATSSSSSASSYSSSSSTSSKGKG